jgi:hypothetical protein
MNSDSQSDGTATIPNELTGRVPRRTRLRLAGNTLMQVGIAAMLITVGVALDVWFAVDNVHQTQHAAALRQGGSEARAAITSLGAEGRSSALTVRYVFSAGGADYKGKALVPHALDSSLQGAPWLPIAYLPADPAINHPTAWEWSVHRSKLFAPMIFVVGGIISLLILRMQRRIVVEGMPAIARITACSSGTGRDGCYGVTYEFHTEDGTVVQGRARSGIVADIGAQTCVLYLPQKPERNMPYGLASYRVVG